MEKADKAVIKKWMLFSGMIFAVVYSLNCFLISPLMSILLDDIIYADTVIPTLLRYLIELLELGAIAFCYAVMLLIIYRWGTEKTKGIFVLFGAATAYKYMSNTVLGWINEGSLPLSWGWDVADVLFYTLLEILQLFIIFILCKGIITKFTDKRKMLIRAAKNADVNNCEMPSDAYPFERIFDMSNCLLRSAFNCAIVTLIAKLGGAVVSDVWLMIAYGAPTESTTWLFMLLNYITKAIIGCVAYLTVFASMSLLIGKKK